MLPRVVARRGAVRTKNLLGARQARLSPAGGRRGRATADGGLPGWTEGARLRVRRRAGARGAALITEIPAARRARAGREQTGVDLSAERRRARVAAVILPVEQHAGRRAARSGGARQIERGGRAR